MPSGLLGSRLWQTHHLITHAKSPPMDDMEGVRRLMFLYANWPMLHATTNGKVEIVLSVRNAEVLQCRGRRVGVDLRPGPNGRSHTKYDRAVRRLPRERESSLVPLRSR